MKLTFIWASGVVNGISFDSLKDEYFKQFSVNAAKEAELGICVLKGDENLFILYSQDIKDENKRTKITDYIKNELVKEPKGDLLAGTGVDNDGLSNFCLAIKNKTLTKKKIDDFVKSQEIPTVRVIGVVNGKN